MNKIQLFSHIDDLTGGYYNGKDVEKFHSNEGWLMFPEKSINSIDEGKKSPYPNIYIHDSPVTKTLTDPLNQPLIIGMTYGNVKASKWFVTLAEAANTKQRIAVQLICSQFYDSSTIISKKTKLCNKDTIPEYLDKDLYKTSDISLSDIINKINLILDGETPEFIGNKNVIWQVPVLDLFKYTDIYFTDIDTVHLDTIFLKIWSAFLLCLAQQTNKKMINKTNAEIELIIGKYEVSKKLNREACAKRYEVELKEKYGIDVTVAAEVV